MATTKHNSRLATALLDKAGTTYADEAGITLKNTPAPLFQLLVLALLLSARISADIAVAAARELFAAGFTTPAKMANAPRSDVIAALGRAHYVRYDESTATSLRETGELLEERYDGDLRKLAGDDPDVADVRRKMQEFKGIGRVGADIFLREVQDAWTWARPYFDKKATESAGRLGLPTDPERLGEVAGQRAASLAAALVRVSLDKELRAEFVD
ncbi:endonuclease [Aldersonia sp. NBC_00410]|uniref:endonuclease n=1 Tax=Aldersonia sp. NBC_00410 TaxID=2975954 RepID=UPI0022561977|nr:endonuclease [Aldersonia sp. NBC_00410]MCX5042918.1 endonuclease [Aldersonia sp. NBC_00410]